MPTSSTRAASMRAHWATIPPEQRRQQTRKARLAHAVRELVDQAPELTETQRQRLAAILRPPEHQDQEAAS
jgi:hypothetical protein